MSKRLLVTVSILAVVTLLSSPSYANWYATQRNNIGLTLMSEGRVDEAIRAFKEAILSYESYQKTKYSLKRAALYFNLAKAYRDKSQTFPLLSRGYEYFWQLGLAAAEKAVMVQYSHPEVSKYYGARPSELFAPGLEAGGKDIVDFLKMRHLVWQFEAARKAAMFEKCINKGKPGASNIMTIGPTEFAPGDVMSPPKPVKTPPGEKSSRSENSGGTSSAVESAAELGDTTAKANR